jgi:hypothetical protein
MRFGDRSTIDVTGVTREGGAPLAIQISGGIAKTELISVWERAGEVKFTRKIDRESPKCKGKCPLQGVGDNPS